MLIGSIYLSTMVDRNFLPTLDLLLNLSLETYFVLFVLCICLFSQVQSSPAREKIGTDVPFFFFLLALDAL